MMESLSVSEGIRSDETVMSMGQPGTSKMKPPPGPTLMGPIYRGLPRYRDDAAGIRTWRPGLKGYSALVPNISSKSLLCRFRGLIKISDSMFGLVEAKRNGSPEILICTI